VITGRTHAEGARDRNVSRSARSANGRCCSTEDRCRDSHLTRKSLPLEPSGRVRGSDIRGSVASQSSPRGRCLNPVRVAERRAGVRHFSSPGAPEPTLVKFIELRVLQDCAFPKSCLSSQRIRQMLFKEQTFNALDRLYLSQNKADFAKAAIEVIEGCLPSVVIAFHEVTFMRTSDQVHECRDARATDEVRRAWTASR